MSKARGLADLGNVYSDGALSNRNLIINGDMRVAQRGTSFTNITNSAPSYTLDRFFAECTTSAGAVLSATQSSDSPSGFNNSISIAVTTSGATSSGDYVYFRQNVEGYNAAHLNLGSSDAQTVTLSFWVKSSVTGTFGGWLGAASNNRFYIYSYTINSANTWEYKTITVSGDTSGTWDTTNGVGLQVTWSLSVGSTYAGATGSWSSSLLLGATGQTNITETASATWQITGVQLEVGDTATPFEHRSYGDELAKCQRYFEKSFNKDQAPAGGLAGVDRASGIAFATTALGHEKEFMVPKRASPTIVFYRGSNTGSTNSGTINVYIGFWSERNLTGVISKETRYRVDIGGSGLTAGHVYLLDFHYTADAEL